MLPPRKIDVELCKRLEEAEALGLRAAVEHALVTFPGRGIALEEIAGATVSYCGPGSFFNQTRGAGLYGLLSDDDLERIIAFYHSRGERAEIEISPVADVELPRKLTRRGFTIDAYQNALTADLSRISGSRDPRVEQCHDAQTWAEISARAFGDGAEPDDELRFIGVLMATHPDVTPLALRENGTIVATACLGRESDGIAGFFAAATMPEARGNGYHSALIGDRIARAKDAGATIARATATIGSTSERNFRRFGFTPVFTRSVWVLEPPNVGM